MLRQKTLKPAGPYTGVSPTPNPSATPSSPNSSSMVSSRPWFHTSSNQRKTRDFGSVRVIYGLPGVDKCIMDVYGAGPVRPAADRPLHDRSAENDGSSVIIHCGPNRCWLVIFADSFN